jgi:hypothetical protein
MTHEEMNALVAELTALRLPELKARYEQALGKPTRWPNRTYLIRSICNAVQGNVTDDAPDAEELARSQDDPIVLSDDDVEDADDAEGHVVPPNSANVAPAAADATAVPGEPEDAPNAPKGRQRRRRVEQSPRGRFSSMTIDELQRKYVEIVGRPTASSHRGYLAWKIREAEKGRVPVGPRQHRARDTAPADVKILPLRLDAEAVEAMDAAWRDRGMKTRMEFLRRALGHYLTHIGAADAAARFGAEPY